MTDNMQRARIIEILKAHTTEMERYGYYSSNPGIPEDDYEEIADEIAALLLAVPEDRPLRPYALRNLRSLIESGSTDKALMLSNLEEL